MFIVHLISISVKSQNKVALSCLFFLYFDIQPVWFENVTWHILISLNIVEYNKNSCLTRFFLNAYFNYSKHNFLLVTSNVYFLKQWNFCHCSHQANCASTVAVQNTPAECVTMFQRRRLKLQRRLIVRWQETHKAEADQHLWSPSEEGYGPEKSSFLRGEGRNALTLGQSSHIYLLKLMENSPQWQYILLKCLSRLKSTMCTIPELLDFPNKKQITQEET